MRESGEKVFQTKRIKISKKKEYILVNIKPDKNERINKRELQIFQQNIFQGIMQPQVSEKNRIVYVAPNGIMLKKYLKSGISRQDFFQVFVQLLEVVRKIQCNFMNINNLVLDLDYTFINENTKEVQIIYQPVLRQNTPVKIFPFFYEVIHSTVFLINEDMQMVNELMGHMKRMQHFSAEDIEDYIEELYPDIFKIVERYKPEQLEATKPAIRAEKSIPHIYLMRVNTHERIEIRKAEFWLGKERAKVDYCITDNPSVSRQHAVIRKRGKNFSIQDNRSTNKTFVNSRKLQSGQEVEILNGNTIMLANERFVFHAE